MVNIEYANAYTEILEILKYIPVEDYNKIPEEKINLFKKNSNKNYTFSYNPRVTLDEQNVSKITKTIIAILFRDYWATPEQKEKIIAKENYDKIKIEKEKAKQYETDYLFKQKVLKTEEIKTNLPVKKQRLFVKIINFIKNIFKRKK